VWVQYRNKGNYGELDGWLVKEYLEVMDDTENYEYIFIADPPFPPPDNWKPEDINEKRN
jgi:hypothetical protein